jgi:hypothetical protein
MVPSNTVPNRGMATRLKMCSRGALGSMNKIFFMGRSM